MSVISTVIGVDRDVLASDVYAMAESQISSISVKTVSH